MIFNELEGVKITARFKFYPYIICNDKRELWQLEHFRNKRTLSHRKIKYNKKRNGYLINGAYVSRNRMTKENNMILVDETIYI